MSITARVLFAAVVIVALYLAAGVFPHLQWEGPVCELPVVVEVLNGCGRAGIAEKVASHLRDVGFDVMYVGNADDFRYPETLVVDRTGDRDKARAVALAMGQAPVVCQTSKAFFVEVTVVLGGDIGTSYGL